MNFLPILLFFICTSASVSASASAKLFGSLKATEDDCNESACADAYYALYNNCGVDTIEDNYSCACKLSLSFYNDIITCFQSCGVIGDASYYSPLNVHSEVCSMAGVSTGRSSSSSTRTSSRTSLSMLSISNSTTPNGGNDLYIGSPSNSLISLIGLVVSLLI